jgi:hypothetical protein
MRCRGQFGQVLEIDRQHVALRVRAKSKTVNRSRRYDDEGRPIQLRLQFLDDNACRSRGEQYALTQLGMPMRADLPKIFAAAGLNVFDVHRSGYASRRTLLAV